MIAISVWLKDTSLQLNHIQPLYQPIFHPPQTLQPVQMTNQTNWAHEFLDESLYVFIIPVFCSPFY